MIHKGIPVISMTPVEKIYFFLYLKQFQNLKGKSYLI